MDYSVAAESPAGAIRNALQILNTAADVSLGTTVTRVPNALLDRARQLLTHALAQLETR